MGTVIDFLDEKNKRIMYSMDKRRISALIHGEIEEYICNNCGGDFEVWNDIKPKSCPHCGFIIDWDLS